MPRVRAAPSTPSTPARGSPLKHAYIPTNDDENEKAARRAVRVAQDDLRRSTIVAAASPRKQAMAVGGPSTPARKVTSVDPAGVGRSPVPKVPVLANFEEWMKMATDNKINAANSWNFALIDYFHEMSLLREGDSINFQKASCTLDGCVKIYTSRVDSVATDTTKLLSGLATSKQSRDEEDRGEGEGDEDDEDREKKPKRRAARAEATLVKDFSSIQLKKFDLEFSVDPLFKKTSADFDEGGAKGLLLNHLGINEEGKIIFDASDAVPADADDVLPEGKGEEEGAGAIDIAALGAKFFADMNALDDMDVCPSLKNFEFPADGSTITFDLPDLKLSDLTDDAASEIDGTVMGDDDLDFGGPLEGFDNDDDVGFGEGGDAWAQTELPPNYDGGENEQLLLEEGAEPLKDLEQRDGFVMSLNSEGSEEGIFAYFDEALRKNWAGPEHWRISRLKKASTLTSTEPKKKKEKEVFSIDFYGEDVEEDVLFAPGGASINMSKAQQMQRSRHLLPDDMGFSSKDLLRLFLKPKATLQNRKKKSVAGGEKEVNEHDMDEKFWAERAAQNAEEDIPSGPSYDAAFFDDGNADAGFGPDMDDDGDGFADAAETLSQAAAEVKEEMDFGSQLVSQGRKMRPEYVNYARVAKKVDVKKLKDNIWSNLAITIPDDDDGDDPTPTPEPSQLQGEEKKFTQVIQDLQKVYPQKEMEDVSTSFCFICLLHLANEKGLVIENEGVGNMEELIIRKDMTVGAIDTY